MTQFLPGDLVFYYNDKNFLNWITRWITCGKGEPATFCSNVAGFISDKNIVEAFWTVRIARFILHSNKEIIKVYRRKGLSEAQRIRIAKQAKSYVNRSYGLMKFITHLGDAFLEKCFGKQIFFFRRLNHFQKYCMCSWVWSFAYCRALGYKFGIEPEEADPDGIYNYINKNNNWVMIFDSSAELEEVGTSDFICWVS